jgi:hypothetical protein
MKGENAMTTHPRYNVSHQAFMLLLDFNMRVRRVNMSHGINLLVSLN